MALYTGSDVFLNALKENGVEHIFFNPGIDNAPLLEAISKFRTSSKETPRGILCLDEFVAMTAAHGNYMVSGKPQVVLVHSELGTQQIGGALHNAQWGRVPVVFCAEPLNTSKRLNWRKEPFDQGTMVRNCVKWDHQLEDNEDLGEVLGEAFRIAASEPCGPVYLVLPRDIYSREFENITSRRVPGGENHRVSQADDTDLTRVAELLIKASNPLIVTGYSGRKNYTALLLVDLAETLSAPVFSADIRMNFPSTHPLFLYLDPDDAYKGKNPYLTNADVILAIDYDMHYAAPPVVPGQDVSIIHIDIDLKKRGEPLWGRSADISIEGDSAEVIPALNEIVNKKTGENGQERLSKRFALLKGEQKRLCKKWQDLATDQSGQIPITPDWLCHCINEMIKGDTIIVNQTITPSMSVVHQIHRSNPGTLLSCAGGSIGWALAAGLGAKLATPEKTVVSLMGDGAFVYGCPVATLWTASYYKIPYLSIIFNNQAYGAIKGLFRERYGVDNMGADISDPPDYAMVARSCGAFGQTVEEPTEIMPVLEEALDQVHKGRPAVLDIRMAQPE
ncbi:thiamine pyrophosphate-dependent enzyme [Thermodesulfobacteriota bacterium]